MTKEKNNDDSETINEIPSNGEIYEINDESEKIHVAYETEDESNRYKSSKPIANNFNEDNSKNKHFILKIPIKKLLPISIFGSIILMNYFQFKEIKYLKTQITTPIEYNQQLEDKIDELLISTKSNQNQIKKLQEKIVSNQIKLSGLESRFIAGNHFINRQQVLKLDENFKDELEYPILIDYKFESLKYNPQINQISLFDNSLDLKLGLTTIIQNFDDIGTSPTTTQIKSLFELISDAYLTKNINKETAMRYINNLNKLFKKDDNAYLMFHSLQKDINFIF